MTYRELMQAFFERSLALQGYWTIYVIVIGGVLGFSTLRRQAQWLTTLLVTVLFAMFAFKNLGAIEATLAERQAIAAALKARSQYAFPIGSRHGEGRVVVFENQLRAVS